MKGRRRQSTKRHKKHRQSKKTRKLSHRRKSSRKGGFNKGQWWTMWNAAAAGGRMERTLQPAVRRLQELARVNPAVTAEEIGTAREELDALTSGLDGVRVRLDAVRLVLVGG